MSNRLCLKDYDVANPKWICRDVTANRKHGATVRTEPTSTWQEAKVGRVARTLVADCNPDCRIISERLAEVAAKVCEWGVNTVIESRLFRFAVTIPNFNMI